MSELMRTSLENLHLDMSSATSTHKQLSMRCQMQGIRLRTSSHPRRIGIKALSPHPARYVATCRRRWCRTREATDYVRAVNTYAAVGIDHMRPPLGAYGAGMSRRTPTPPRS
jgi:hypothetical protein